MWWPKKREARRPQAGGLFRLRLRLPDRTSGLSIHLLPASGSGTRPVGQATKSSALKRAGVHPHSAPLGTRNVGSNRMPMNEAEDSRATITADQRTPVALNSSSLPVPPGLRASQLSCVSGRPQRRLARLLYSREWDSLSSCLHPCNWWQGSRGVCIAQ